MTVQGGDTKLKKKNTSLWHCFDVDLFVSDTRVDAFAFFYTARNVHETESSASLQENSALY